MSTYNAKCSGFTLIEVMISLAIIGIAMGALLKGGGQAAKNLQRVENKLHTEWIASNVIAEIQMSTLTLEPGEYNGSEIMGHNSYKWDARVSATQYDGIDKIEITVRDSDRGTGTKVTGYLMQ